jgi:hypothetical protein
MISIRYEGSDVGYYILGCPWSGFYWIVAGRNYFGCEMELSTYLITRIDVMLSTIALSSTNRGIRTIALTSLLSFVLPALPFLDPSRFDWINLDQ